MVSNEQSQELKAELEKAAREQALTFDDLIEGKDVSFRLFNPYKAVQRPERAVTVLLHQRPALR
jgi:hypothetical protein